MASVNIAVAELVRRRNDLRDVRFDARGTCHCVGHVVMYVGDGEPEWKPKAGFDLAPRSRSARRCRTQDLHDTHVPASTVSRLGGSSMRQLSS